MTDAPPGAVLAPMPARLVALSVQVGDSVPAGAELAVLAHLWVDDLAGAEEALARALLPDHADAPSVRALTGLIALRSGERIDREPVDDGWPGTGEDDSPGPQTRVLSEHARSIISRNRSPDIFFDLSINPYRGCEHGCIYCYARPNHGTIGLSPGLDFETRLFAKINAAALLRKALASPSYRCEPINIGSVTDPYQPIERRFRITREVLEVALAHRQPVTLITKSSLVERDLDLVAALAHQSLATVCITVTTLDAGLARILEPRATAPWRRIETIRRLASAGIPVGVSIGPLIPFINDQEIESLLAAAREAGARRRPAGALQRRGDLPGEQRLLVPDMERQRPGGGHLHRRAPDHHRRAQKNL